MAPRTQAQIDADKKRNEKLISDREGRISDIESGGIGRDKAVDLEREQRQARLGVTGGDQPEVIGAEAGLKPAQAVELQQAINRNQRPGGATQVIGAGGVGGVGGGGAGQGTLGGLSPNELATSKQLFQEAGGGEVVSDVGRRELSPEVIDRPFIPAELETTADVIQRAYAKLVPGIEYSEGDRKEPDYFITAETNRDKALAQISKDAFDEGISRQDAWGALFETLPGLSTAAKFLPLGLPTSNILAIEAEISKEREFAITELEKLTKGLIPPEQALASMQASQDNIAKLQGRLDNLLLLSDTLRENPEDLDSVETTIERAKTMLEAARVGAEAALAKKLTGAGTPIAEDIQIIAELSK